MDAHGHKVNDRPFFSCREQDHPIAIPMECNPDKTVIIDPDTRFVVHVIDKDFAEDDYIGSAWLPAITGKPYVDLEMETRGDLNKVTIRLEGPLP